MQQQAGRRGRIVQPAVQAIEHGVASAERHGLVGQAEIGGEKALDARAKLARRMARDAEVVEDVAAESLARPAGGRERRARRLRDAGFAQRASHLVVREQARHGKAAQAMQARPALGSEPHHAHQFLAGEHGRARDALPTQVRALGQVLLPRHDVERALVVHAPLLPAAGRRNATRHGGRVALLHRMLWIVHVVGEDREAGKADDQYLQRLAVGQVRPLDGGIVRFVVSHLAEAQQREVVVVVRRHPRPQDVALAHLQSIAIARPLVVAQDAHRHPRRERFARGRTHHMPRGEDQPGADEEATAFARPADFDDAPEIRHDRVKRSSSAPRLRCRPRSASTSPCA